MQPLVAPVVTFTSHLMYGALIGQLTFADGIITFVPKNPKDLVDRFEFALAEIASVSTTELEGLVFRLRSGRHFTVMFFNVPAVTEHRQTLVDVGQPARDSARWRTVLAANGLKVMQAALLAQAAVWLAI